MRHALICVWALSMCAVAGAQAPTGTLTGTVVDRNHQALAGVRVSVTSPHLQGTRRAVSSATGGYILALLPPGDYRVKFELAGYQIVELPAKLNGAQTTNLAVELRPPGAAATASGAVETISTTAPVAATGEASVVEALPSGRDLAAFAVETPGVVEEADGNVSIAGGQKTETAYLVDGVVSSDPVARTLYPLYVEDGIEEATVQVSRISAEYGRFTGGILNALTKSGGNEFHGSARALLTSESWSAPTPKTLKRASKINKQYEATLGGRILTDKLWFFAAVRSYDTAGTAYIFDTNLAPAETLPTSTDETRYEGKLTFSPVPEHRVVATYVSRERDFTNYVFPAYPVYDTASFYDRQVPQDLLALHYSGVLTDEFFVEGQYSRVHVTFRNSGSRFTDLVKGTPVWDNTAGAVYNSPIFCAVCTNAQEDRVATEVLLKGSLFLSSRSLGTHDLRFGANAYDGTDLVNNWQSGSGYNLDASAVLQNGNTFYPVMDPNELSSYIEWWPIFNLAKRLHLKTYSLFANDVWRPSPNLTLSLGARWDKPDVTDSSGAKVPTASKISPRLSATWDPKGDGDWQINLGYAAYVASISTIANAQSTAGQLAYYNMQYGGPAINADCDPEHPTASTCHDTAQVLQMVFDWLRSLPGADGDLQKAFLANPQLWGPGPPQVPGYQTFIGPDLSPPSVKEWSLGVVKKLAGRGVARLDYVNRTWRDFYSSRVDTTTGTTTDPYGNRYDREIIENTNSLERIYRGLLLQGQYRVSDALLLGADYTYSRTLSRGTPAHYYPEYWEPSWNNPERDVRRHRGSVYGTYTAFDSRYHRLSAGLAFRYVSGNPYTAAGSVLVAPYVDATNLPYVNPPSTVEYFFQAPGAYHTDDITTTDLALSYSFKIPGLRGLEFRIDPQVTNVFNNQAVTAVNGTVYTRANGASRGLSAFNPFTTAPKECPQGSTRAQCSALGANWMKGPLFGKPTSPGSYQEPRTVSVYVGVRF